MMCARFFCLDLCLVFLVTECATLFERKSCGHVCSMERIDGEELHFELQAAPRLGTAQRI